MTMSDPNDILFDNLTFSLSPNGTRGRFRPHYNSLPLDQPLSQKETFYIRPWKSTDIDCLLQHLNNEKIVDHLNSAIPFPYSKEDAEEWVQFNQQKFDDMKRFVQNPQQLWPKDQVPVVTHFAICVQKEKQRDMAIGGLGFDLKNFYVYNPTTKVQKPTTCRLGYWLAEEHWNKGIVTNAIKVLLNEYICSYLETLQIKIHRIECFIYTGNPASEWVVEKNGFYREGVMREIVKKNGKWRSATIYSLVRNDVFSV